MKQKQKAKEFDGLIVRKKAIIFDLDGTLLDTLEDIANSVNYVLLQYKKEPIEAEKYRYLVGSGALKLIQDVLPQESEESIKNALSVFEKHYVKEYDKHTKLYDGIAKLLTFLQKKGLKMAILSNKPDSFTKLCAIKYLRNWKFEAVYGIREGIPRKPDPAGALEIMKELHVEPSECLYMGDTKIDMITAKSANIDSIGVLWGFRDKEELEQNGAKYIATSQVEAIKLISNLIS